MTCDEYRAAILAGEGGATHAHHLATCASCRAEQESLAVAAALLGDPVLWEEPGPGVEDQVVAAILGTEAAAPAPRRGLRRRLAPVAAFAAALVLVVSAVAAGTALLAGDGADWEVAIAGTDLTPGAGGTVLGWNTGAGTRVAFDVAGLEAAPDGFVYELWFSAERVHVSGGTFRSPDDVELWVGVSRRDFPRIWVTLEPIDADSAPSGRVVLDTRS